MVRDPQVFRPSAHRSGTPHSQDQGSRSEIDTVHFVYPHGPAISCPEAIGRKLAAELRRHYNVIQYEWDDSTKISARPNDVLLGHPHPFPWTTFRRSMRDPAWRRVIAMIPYSHGSSVQMAWADSTVARCDLLLAITGDFWFSTVAQSVFSHWLPKMVHLDLAVDPAEFPPIKQSFNPPGRRRFLYIGGTSPAKNTPYLSQIAKAIPHTRFSWAGKGRMIEGVEPLGFLDFSSQAAKQLVAEHDFLITVGSSDANPATILEAMAWGLIPVCTAGSGYSQNDGMVHLPLGNMTLAVEKITSLQELEEARLRKMQTFNQRAIKNHFNWDRFNRQVVEAIQSDSSPPLLRESIGKKLKLVGAAAVSPYSFWRPTQARNAIRTFLR